MYLLCTKLLANNFLTRLFDTHFFFKFIILLILYCILSGILVLPFCTVRCTVVHFTTYCSNGLLESCI